jgi:hypothetical protein
MNIQRNYELGIADIQIKGCGAIVKKSSYWTEKYCTALPSKST